MLWNINQSVGLHLVRYLPLCPPPTNNPFNAVIQMQESPPHKRFSVVACPSTYHQLVNPEPLPGPIPTPWVSICHPPLLLRAWCKQMSAWSVKTRRAPSRPL
ncbi:unnamed protein product [Laminaria digitata]